MTRRAQTTRAGRGERRWLAIIGIATLALFVLLAVWAHFTVTPQWESDFVTAVALGQNLPGDALVTVNTLGNLQNWAILIAVLALAVGLLRGFRAGALVGLSFAVDLVASLTKAFVERGRPDTDAAHLLYGVDSYGFPSGHAARAAALAGALIWVFAPPRWRMPAAIAGALIGGLGMAYARISLGVHFPTDTIGGVLLGLAWVALSTIAVL